MQGWLRYAGRSTVVMAPPASFAVTRAAQMLREADRTAAELERLLGVTPLKGAPRLEILLVDATPGGPAEAPVGAGVPEGGAPPGAPAPLLRVISPEGPAEPLARAMTRVLAGQWLGGRAAAATTVLDGLAGLVAARVGTGPPRADADAWVQARLADGRLTSLFADAPPAIGGELMLTSFAGYLLDEFGPAAVREFLRTYDPERHDRAAVAVFHAPLGTLEEQWHARQRQQASGGTQVRAFASQVVPLLHPHTGRLVELTVLMLLATVNTLALPLGFRYFVDHILPSGQVDDLVLFTIVLGVLFLAGTAIGLRRVFLASRLGEQIGVELQEQMFVHMQRMGHAYFTRVRSGDLLSRFTRDLVVVQQALVSLAGGAVALIISAIAAFVTLAILNIYIGLLVASVLPMYVIAHAVLHARFRSLSYERQHQAGESASVLQESMAAHDLIKAYGGEDRALEAYRVRLLRQLDTAYRLVMTGAGLQASVGLMTAVAQIEILCLGGYLVIKGHLSLGTLLAAISLAPSVLQPVNQLSQTTQNAQAAAGAMSRIHELLDHPPDIVDRPDAVVLGSIGSGLELDDVTLTYGLGRPSLDGVSLRIPAGAHVAFVGPSGAGKTSVLNLLLRFYDPTSGRLLVGGHDARDVTVASLRARFGVILQDTFVFNTTVRANIAFGRPEATDAEIAAAAQAAQLHEFIIGLPAGYETVLGDRGVRMSGGQRQRLAIARALLRNPDVLILDEATSALDARTEADMRRSLAEAGRGRTVVTISHRLSSVVASDCIYVLAAGRLAEAGTHDELLAHAGLYRQLWAEQHGDVAAAPGGGAWGLVDAAAALRGVPLLAEVPDAALEELAQTATHERYGPGTEVGAPGQPMGRLVVVLDGELELTRDDGESTVGGGLLGPGDFLGELALLHEQRFPMTLRAITPVRLLTVLRSDFLAVAGDRPELQRAVLRQLTRRRAVLASAASATRTGGERLQTTAG